MATKRMNDQWARIRDRIKAVWSDADLTNKEMKRTRGNLQKLVNLIHEKTGQPRAEIRQTVYGLY